MRISDWSSDVCSSDLNALVAAADLALRLNALKSLELKVNPAKIDGGGPNNVVPDQAILRVNMRPMTPAAMTAAEVALRGTIANIQRDRSAEHTSELQSLMRSSYAVLCSNNKINRRTYTPNKIT